MMIQALALALMTTAGVPLAFALQAGNGPETNTPQTCTVLHQQSAAELASRNYRDAVSTLRQAVSVCPNRREVLLALAKAEMLSQQFDASASTLHELLADNSRDAAALTILGELDYLLGKMPDAVTALEAASAAAPQASEPHYILGRVYYQQSNTQLAKTQFELALHLDPDAYRAYDGLALCYENLGDTGAAANTYMKGIAAVYKAHPDYDVIYADFAELMLRFHESQKAFDLAAEAASRNPHAPRNFLLAGQALEQSARYPESLRWLNHAAQMDPTYPDPHLQMARIYRRLGDPSKAQREADIFRKLTALAPQPRR
jgi:tetratricopeptide (TPR) repeat protein